jgi:excisionase family DNA binding protein
MPKYISTSEAARIAGVTPSSIKRWADQNRLPCEKTAGGHRRFELGALRRFMEGVIESEKPNTDVADWTNVLSKGAHNATLARLYQSLHERKQWCHVADGLGPVLKSIGDQWASGTLTIAEEHVASDTLTRALTHIGSGLGIGNGSRRALLATVEGDQHELGLRLADLCLKARMWDSMWLGRDTPTTVLVDKIMNERLDIVALSASVNAGPSRELISHVSRVAEACRSQGVLLVLGGDGTWPEIEGAVRARSFAEFDTLLTRLF